MKVRCPECDSPIDRENIYLEQQMVFCDGAIDREDANLERICDGATDLEEHEVFDGDGCSEKTHEHPTLADCELPTPQRLPKPEEHICPCYSVVTNNGDDQITVSLPPTEARDFGVWGILIALILILAPPITYGLATIYDEPPAKITPAGVAFVAALVIFGIIIGAWGVWALVGSARVSIGGDQLVFGKTFFGIWLKQTYDLDDLADIRRTPRKIPKDKVFGDIWRTTYAVGFFLEGEPQPLILKGYAQNRHEVDWLVGELYHVWQQNVAK